MISIKRNGEETRSLTHINEKCVGCGICKDICPTEAIKTGPILPIARGLVKMDYINLDGNKCALCGLCATACPFDALEFQINGSNIKDMEEYPKWNHDAEINDAECIYCKACESSCPQDAITIARQLPTRSKLVTGEISVNQEKCINCKVCEEMCPAEAIKIEQDSPTSYEVKIDEDKCVYCLVCKRICPTEAIKAVCASCAYSEYNLKPEDAKITGQSFLNKDNCVNCGWCQEICPVDAAVITKPFEGSITTDREICKGDSCHACMDVCPCNAVSLVDGKSQIDQKFCILCGACTQVCPQSCIDLKRESVNLDNVRSKSWQKQMGKLVTGSTCSK
jgi:4Fe-4S ferredoxin